MKSAKVGRIAFLATLMDVALLLILIATSGELVGDENTWHTLAVQAAQFLNGESSDAVVYVAGKEGYIWIVGALYAVSGPAPLVAIALGIICHALLVVVVAKTTELIADSADAEFARISVAVRRSAYLTALAPSLVWWSPHILRESITYLLVAVAVCWVVHAFVKRRAAGLIAAALALAILTWIRGTLGLTVSIAIAFALIYIVLGQSRFRLLLRGSLFLGLLLLLQPIQSTLSELLGVSEERVVGTTTELSSIAESGFPGLGGQASLVDVLTVTAPRVLVGPFPWEFSPTAVMLLAFVELACWVLVAVLALRSLSTFRPGGALHDSRGLTSLILVVVVVILIGLALTVGNYGILARFRPMAMVALLPLAAIGLTRWGPPQGASNARATQDVGGTV
ncbi:hypothetical protein AB0269_01145 [Microbacterium sp. NPDC077644]|uniref:hypothetical protein n=1 Tax=Microbacterium sp. NPDC077644 TaxID=3155055 RepID=UPI00344B1231